MLIWLIAFKEFPESHSDVLFTPKIVVKRGVAVPSVCWSWLIPAHKNLLLIFQGLC